VASVPGIDELNRQIDGGTPVQRLSAASELADRLRARGDELLDLFVAAAREAGVSWSEIGRALGTSKQAAHERFAALADPAAGQAPFGLTGTAADVLGAAGVQARELGHHTIRPEHLILGLLAQPQELAAEVLTELGVTVEGAREQLARRLGSGPARPDGSLGVSPQTKRLLEQARAIARSLGSRCPKTEHILLAATSPKLRSPAAGLLTDCGATPDQVRDQLTATLLREAPELAERLRNRSLRSRVRLRSI
jgi:hypothetical protein